MTFVTHFLFVGFHTFYTYYSESSKQGDQLKESF